MQRFIPLGLLALVVIMNPTFGQGGLKQVKPLQKWTGKIANNDLLKNAPKSGMLPDKKSLEQLWKAWRGDEKLPEIDFAKHLVLVHIAAGGPNIPTSTYTVSAEGELKAKTLSTLLGGPGFGYSIELLNKEGIKTYQGKAIE